MDKSEAEASKKLQQLSIIFFYSFSAVLGLSRGAQPQPR
jgi:hypothetical protein